MLIAFLTLSFSLTGSFPLTGSFSLIGGLDAPDFSSEWTRFRGPAGNGRVEGPAPPTEWSSEANVAWKAPLPGSGTSSPIVTKDRIYVTAYTGYGVDPEAIGELDDLARHLLAFDRATGAELWRATVPGGAGEDPYKGFIRQHGYASSTPATDGENVFALFGKAGLFAFDRDGEEVWSSSVGTLSDPAKWGSGTSPIVVDGTVVVDAGILGHRLAGLDAKTGETRWTIEDEGYTNSWSTPVTIGPDDDRLVLFSVPKKVIAVRPATGEVVWEIESPMDDSTAASVVSQGEMAYLMGTRAGRGMAIRCFDPNDAEKGPEIAWKRNIRSGICTPIAVGDGMYWGTGGIFMGASLADGGYLFRERLPRFDGPTGGFPNSDYSSPVAVDDLIYQFTRNGESYVIRAGPSFDLVSHNPAFAGDESAFSSSPAIADGQLFIRSERFLYCIDGDESVESSGN